MIEKFLPAQMNDEDLKKALRKLLLKRELHLRPIWERLWELLQKNLSGRADGKSISAAVKELLAK